MKKETSRSAASTKAKRAQQKTIKNSKPTLENAPNLADRILNVLPDAPDLRDRYYEPALLDLAMTMAPPSSTLSPIRDQETEGACTGFALASAVTLMNTIRRRRISPGAIVPMASPRMLYEMAKIHDEWPGEDYEGSSIRGALKGFFHNGVCSEELAQFVDKEVGWSLTREQAEDARNTGLGAYYRLHSEIIDYHAALNEAGVIYVSSQVHRGWQKPVNGEIAISKRNEGGHAFVIVGYDSKGFLIQNSWGETWGGFDDKPGIARWLYEDWSANVMDAWVLRLSVPTPEAFDLTITKPKQEPTALFESSNVKKPRRDEIIGHFIHLDDGNLVETGHYATPLPTIKETANFLADENATADRDYKHLLFYAHGGLNDSAASADRIKMMKEVFKRNGIYPIHFMWETGFFESLKDVLTGAGNKAEGRVGNWFTDITDRAIEAFARGPGTAIWRDMKGDAVRSFAGSGGGRAAVKALLQGNAQRSIPLKVHLVGHSAGAIFLARMLKTMNAMNPLSTPVQTCSLMAPACSIDLFNSNYAPSIGKTSSADGVSKLIQYNLIDSRELDDSVLLYRKSLLYFISRAFEDESERPILGMEVFADDLNLKSQHEIVYAGRASSRTDAKDHGDFDNDRATMNDILKSILGQKPSAADGFQTHELEEN